MVVVRLSGGLGNQLFQYAMGRYLSFNANTELLLEDSFFFQRSPNLTPRTFELDKFAIQARRTSAEERKALRSYTGKIWKRIRRVLPIAGQLRYVHEPVGKFLPTARAHKDQVFLDGYWQSSAYFSGIGDLLRDELQLLLPMSKEDQQIANRMAQVDAISLHVRRGDYLSNPAANKMHGVCSLDYYQKAIKFMAGQLSNPVFFVFSDDLDWVNRNLQIDHPCVYVDHNSSVLAVHDLRLMSLAGHHIIANSSFSWWGAWMNPSTSKKVVRPKRWYAGLPSSGDQTCPANWIAL
jgi:hypothetical protein